MNKGQLFPEIHGWVVMRQDGTTFASIEKAINPAPMYTTRYEADRPVSTKQHLSSACFFPYTRWDSFRPVYGTAR